jgi:hypothetical protein
VKTVVGSTDGALGLYGVGETMTAGVVRISTRSAALS